MSVPASGRPLTLAVYNPDLLNKEDLIRGFVARKTLLDRLLGDLRRETRDDSPPQPYLVLGQRGLGKTTLLRRLAYAIEDDPDLGAAWVPLVFPEEQYNIAMLSDFWLNCVDALGDAIERSGDLAAYRALDARVEGMSRAEPERRRQTLELLVAEAERLGKRLMLLIDNIDIVFNRLGDEDDWEFRRILSSEPRLLLIGASSRALEAVYDYGRPFYEYFQVHELKGLDEAETFDLLQALAEQTGQSAVADLLNGHPARVRTLRLLTGGNPRTLVVLFRILAQAPDGEVDRDLEQLLDLHTPLYKARFEELSTQAQQVVDAMAIHWDPLTAALLAEAARLPVSQISAQLQRLEDSGVVEKTEWYGEKKTAYQIAERFFNIWYLMRASRRVRRKLIWLVKFLEIWFDQEELRLRARAYLRKAPEDGDRQRYAERAFAYAEAVKHRPLRTALEHAGLHTLIDDEAVRQIIDFSDLPPELQDKRLRMERMCVLHEQVRTLSLKWGGIDRQEFWWLLGGSPRYNLEEKSWTVQLLPTLTPVDLKTLFDALQREHDRIVQAYPHDTAVVDKIYGALAGGDMADVYDVEAAIAIGENEPYRLLPYIAVSIRVSSELSPESLPAQELQRAESVLRGLTDHDALKVRAWIGLGNLLSQRMRRYEEAEHCYRRAIELAPRDAEPWEGLGDLLSDNLQRYEEAEQAYRRAIELDPQNGWPWIWLGLLLDHLQRYEETEQAYRRAIELDPQNAWPWIWLGNLLSDHLERYEEAEQAYRRAVKLESQLGQPWNSLGGLLSNHLQRYEEAEQAYRRAMELDPQDAWPWIGLGDLLSDHFQRHEEAEQAYRRAIELDPQNAWPWFELGNLLSDHVQRYEEAEQAYRRAIELHPQKAWPWIKLANLLSDRLQRYEEAEQTYRRAIGLEPQNAWPWIWLGILLSDHLQRPEEAEQAYRRAIELAPENAWVWDNLGILLSAQLQRHEEAEQAYRRAIELDPLDAWAWNNLGVLLSEQLRRYEEAEQAYRRAIELNPKEALQWENLGELLQDRLRRHPEGAAAFLQALELDKSLADARLGLLDACTALLADTATQKQAVALIRRGLDLLPDDAGLKATLAQGLALTEQWPEAQGLLADIAQGAEWERSFTSLLAAIVATAHAKEALAVLEQAGAHESWRPLYEALRAAAEGSAKYLRRVAPEVRVVAEEILREIAPHLYET